MFLQQHAVAGLRLGLGPLMTVCADLDLVRGEHVALLTVGVLEQVQAGVAVRVVLERDDLGRDTVLVAALPVDDAVEALVPATAVAHGHAAVVVAAAGLAQTLR